MVEHSPACGSQDGFPTPSMASDVLTQDIPFYQKCHYGKWHRVVSQPPFDNHFWFIYELQTKASGE
jgi:hypothetical protein